MTRTEAGMISTRSWRWPLAVALVLLATGVVVRLLTASDSEPSLDDDVAVVEEDESTFEPIDLPEPRSGSVEALGPSAITRSPKELLPPKLSGGKGPKREFVVRVIDRDGNGVAGASVGVWTKNASHPFAKTLLASRDAFMARYYPGSPADADSLSWTWIAWADPTWRDPVELRQTDENGHCMVALADGTVAMAAAHDTAGLSGRWIGEPWQALAGPEGSEPFELLLLLRPPGHITGRVVDAGGQPVAGALVCASSVGGKRGACEPRLPRPVACDDDGRFVFECSAPAFQSVYALGHGQWSSQRFLSVQPDGNVDITLRIGNAALLAGRVLDAHGEPVGGAEVHASGPGFVHERTTSGDDGGFTLGLSDTGHWLVGAVKSPWVPEDVVTVDVGATAPTPVTLRLIEGAGIKGRVRLASGEPAVSLRVTATPNYKARLDVLRVAGLGMPFQRSTSDAEGLFELTSLHPALHYDLRAGQDWKPLVEADAEDVAPGAFVEIQVKEVEPESWSLDGRVVDDETGEPIPAFSVSVGHFRNDDDALPFGREYQPFRSPDGSFHVENIRWAKGYVRVVAAGYAERIAGPASFAARKEPLEITLGRPARLDVSVVDEAGGPVADAAVLLTPKLMDRDYDSSVAREVTTDAAGHALWVGLPPDNYSVQAIAGERRTPIETVGLLSGGQHVHALKLDPAAECGSLDVRVLDAAGVRVPGAAVKLMTWGSSHDDSMPRRLKADAEGRVMFSGLAPGHYSLFGEISGGGAFTSASVTAGAATVVELRPKDS